MLQQARAEDFVIATGKQYSVREFITWTAAALGLTLRFAGAGVQERACVAAIQGDMAPGQRVGDCVVSVDPRHEVPVSREAGT